MIFGPGGGLEMRNAISHRRTPQRSILEMQRGGCGHFFQPNLLSPQTWQRVVTVRGLTKGVRINQESLRKLCELEMYPHHYVFNTLPPLDVS